MIPLATSVTALLVYFGWSYSHAKATRLGFDSDLLDQSTRTLVVMSANTILRPMFVVFAIAFVWLEVRALIRRRIVIKSAEVEAADEPGTVSMAVTISWLLFAAAAIVLVAAVVSYVLFSQGDRDVRALGPWYYRHLIPPLALALISLLVVEGLSARNRIHPTVVRADALAAHGDPGAGVGAARRVRVLVGGGVRADQRSARREQGGRRDSPRPAGGRVQPRRLGSER